MEWIRVQINTAPSVCDIVGSMLLDFGIGGYQVDDSLEFEQFLREKKPYWDDVDKDLVERLKTLTCVTIYLPSDANGREMLISIRDELERLHARNPEFLPSGTLLKIDSVYEEDWETAWKAYFHPIEIGEKTLICPQWEKPPENCERAILWIDPGMAFGTGAHPSTRLCMEAAEKHVRPGCDVLDIGCGSGILFIQSMLLGAGSAAAVELDPTAAKIAVNNAADNGLETEKVTVHTGDIISDDELFGRLGQKQYDVVFCNIVSDVIIALMPRLASLVKREGVVILSGIIDKRCADVLAGVHEHNLTVLEQMESDGWCCLVCGIAG